MQPATTFPPRQRPSPLRLRRLALGLRQRDVAELSGMSRDQVARLEVGSCSPGLRTAQRLARVLRCGAEEIFPPADADSESAFVDRLITEFDATEIDQPSA